MEKTKPKIALLHYTYPPVIGGVEIIVHEQANLFVNYGYSPTVFAGEGRSDNPKIPLIEISEFKPLSVLDPRVNEKINNSIQFPQEFYQLKEKISQKIDQHFKNIDIVIAHNILSLNLNPCLSLALIDYFKKNPDKKLISWIHDPVIFLKNGQIVKKTFINKQLENLVYEPIKGIYYVAISNSLKEILVTLIGYPEKIITVIPNGINIQKFLDLDPVTCQIYCQYYLSQADLLIFLPSKILKHKNIDLTIKVFAEILKQRKNSVLIISGKKNPHSKNVDYVNQVLQLIKDLKLENNIIFLVDEMKKLGVDYNFHIVKDFYQLSDVVLFLSGQENFGLPIIEAGLVKTMVISSSLKIFKEIASSNLKTIDIYHNSPEKIAQILLNAVDHNSQIKLLQKIRKEYDFKTIFKNKIIPYIINIFKNNENCSPLL